MSTAWVRTTLPAVAEVQTEEAGGVEQQPAFGAFVATLNGSLAPDGFDTHYYFEYGETEAYGSVSPAPPGTDAGSASEVEHARALKERRGERRREGEKCRKE